MEEYQPQPDSQVQSGGEIPGSGGLPAFTASGPSPSAIPVLISVPHAGRAYDDALLATMRDPAGTAMRLEDRYVDRVAAAIACATGAGLIVAHAPRAMIDLNRSPDDVDWSMVRSAGKPRIAPIAPGGRARTGLGIVPRRLAGVGEIWKSALDQAELDARIAAVHAPYHGCIAATLDALVSRWGAALLIDLHSMPPLPARPGQVAPAFVLGDRFGASCAGSLVGAAFAELDGRGRAAAHNRPYSGGYVLERHGAPRHGRHALQIEIDRRIYLDDRLREPGTGLEAVVRDLVAMVHRLSAEVVDVGNAGASTRWAEAAE